MLDSENKRRLPAYIQTEVLKGLRRPFPVLHTSATVSSGFTFYLFFSLILDSHPSRYNMIFNTQNALAVTSVLLAATSAAADGFQILPRGASGTLVGCYSAVPGYGDTKSWTYQSSGWCLDRCYGESKAAFALTGGSNCICGDTLPPSSDKVSDDKCNKPCSGWPDDMCMLIPRSLEYQIRCLLTISNRWWL